MQFDRPRIPTTPTLSVAFEDGVLSVFYKHDPPVHLGSRLGYRMEPDEARELAAALTEWANARGRR